MVLLHPKEVPLRSEEHTSELQSQSNLVCRLLLEKKNKGKLPRTNCGPGPSSTRPSRTYSLRTRRSLRPRRSPDVRKSRAQHTRSHHSLHGPRDDAHRRRYHTRREAARESSVGGQAAPARGEEVGEGGGGRGGMRGCGAGGGLPSSGLLGVHFFLLNVDGSPPLPVTPPGTPPR